MAGGGEKENDVRDKSEDEDLGREFRHGRTSLEVPLSICKKVGSQCDRE
jgi:hypothetical protein